jgi:hypothetical protein
MMFVAASVVVCGILSVADESVEDADIVIDAGAAVPSLFLTVHVIPVPPLVCETVNDPPALVVSKF